MSISKREEMEKRVGIFSPEILSRVATPVRHPSNSSERDVSFVYEGFECLGVVVTAAVTDVTARIESAIRVVQRKGSRKSGDKRSSRSGRVREISSDLSRAATAKKKKEGRKRETWAEIRASLASRRSQVENAGPEKKNPYRRRRRPEAEPDTCTIRRVLTPFTATHRGANDNSSAWQRPSYCHFSFLSLTLYLFPDPLQPLFKRSSSDLAILSP